MLAERVRIARELHDSVAQTLYAITLSASRALRLIDQTDAEKLQHVVEDVIQLANGGQTELRALVSNLRSDVLVQRCLSQALSALVSEMQQRYISQHANKEIAASLAVAETTVKSHVSAILDKLEVQSRTQAALKALELDLLSADGLRAA